MPITAEYDREADALYVRLNVGERHRAVEAGENTYVDVDVDGLPLGIELLYPSLGIDLDGALQRFRLEQHAPVILAAIARAGTNYTVPTYTGGTHMASSTVTTVTVEGTVGASYETLTAGVAKPDRLIQA